MTGYEWKPLYRQTCCGLLDTNNAPPLEKFRLTSNRKTKQLFKGWRITQESTIAREAFIFPRFHQYCTWKTQEQMDWVRSNTCLAQEPVLGGACQKTFREHVCKKKGTSGVVFPPFYSLCAFLFSGNLQLKTNKQTRGWFCTFLFNILWWLFPPWIYLIPSWTNTSLLVSKHPVPVSSTTELCTCMCTWKSRLLGHFMMWPWLLHYEKW